MKFKKIALSIGTLATIVMPIATVVSCGSSSTQYSEDDLLRMSNLKSSEAHSKLQDLWLSKVLINEYKMTEKNPLEVLKNLDKTVSTDPESKFENDFKTTLTWVLKNKLFTTKDALSSIYQSLKSNAPDSIINKSKVTDANDGQGAQRDIVTYLNTKVFDRSNIDSVVNKIMTDDYWKNIFYNYSENSDEESTFNPSILGIKDLILKMMITKKYLTINAKTFKDVLPEDYGKIASKYKDKSLITETASNFPLVISIMNSRLAYKTSIELAANKSRQYIVSNIDNNLLVANLPNVFKYDSANLPGSTMFHDALTYTMKSQIRVDDILAKVPSFAQDADETIGFQGLNALPSGKDNLDTSTVSTIKLAKTPDARDGFVVDEKLLTKNDVDDDDDTLTKIRFTDKDKTKVELNYYTSLMPTYNTTDKTLEFEGVDDKHLDILMNEAYSKDSTLFSEAIKYYTAEKDGDNTKDPILLTVTNDWARDYYINEGITYIDDEKQD